jgi:hypothetical protein
MGFMVGWVKWFPPKPGSIEPKSLIVSIQNSNVAHIVRRASAATVMISKIKIRVESFASRPEGVFLSVSKSVSDLACWGLDSKIPHRESSCRSFPVKTPRTRIKKDRGKKRKARSKPGFQSVSRKGGIVQLFDLT